MVYKETDSAFGKENQGIHLKQFTKIDWEKVIGMRITSTDNLDMGELIADPDKNYNTSYLIDIEYETTRGLKFQKKLYTKSIMKICIQH